MTKNVEVEQTR